jgi:proline iminopeptidase
MGLRSGCPLRGAAPGRCVRGGWHCGKGPQRDRTWSEAYHVGQATEPVVDIDWVPEVHAALSESFTEWIHKPELWRSLADCDVPMHFIAAGDDIRPSWPLAQLATLVPRGRFSTVPGVPHDFCLTHPELWAKTVAQAVANARTGSSTRAASH